MLVIFQKTDASKIQQEGSKCIVNWTGCNQHAEHLGNICLLYPAAELSDEPDEKQFTVKTGAAHQNVLFQFVFDIEAQTKITGALVHFLVNWPAAPASCESLGK